MGRFLYASVGSNSNAGERGIEAEKGRAAIWQVDRTTGASRVYASGLRNPNGLNIHPETGELWTVVNERDELGPNLVPDYLTSVREGGFYGWPWSYYGQHVDERVRPARPDLVQTAIPPDYALTSHVAALGLAFTNGSATAGSLSEWRVRRQPRQLEPEYLQRLQGHIRALHGPESHPASQWMS